MILQAIGGAIGFAIGVGLGILVYELISTFLDERPYRILKRAFKRMSTDLPAIFGMDASDYNSDGWVWDLVLAHEGGACLVFHGGHIFKIDFWCNCIRYVDVVIGVKNKRLLTERILVIDDQSAVADSPQGKFIKKVSKTIRHYADSSKPPFRVTAEDIYNEKRKQQNP